MASASAAPIGKADSVVPATTYVRGSAARGLAINDALEQEDIIRTSHNGSTRVRFLDDTMLTIGPDAEIRLDKGVFDGSQARTLSIKVITGAMRFVSGVSSRNSYEIRTPIAAIGVRGTVVDISYNPNRSRTIVNFVDGSGSTCMIATAKCRTISAGGTALAISPNGFSPATAAEAAQLWGRLDAAHLALARQAGRDPSAPSGAAAATTAPVTASSNNGQGSSNNNASSNTATGGNLPYVPPPPYNQIVLSTNPVTPIADTLTYVANAVSRVYGAANPAFTGTVIGLQNNDVLGNVTTGTPAFSSAATASSNVGTYAVNGSGLTVTSANYSTDVLQALGNATALTIVPATLTYTANAASRPFGAANPTFTGSVTGLQNGNALGSVTSGTLTFLSTATPASAVGQYPIDGSGLTVTSPNYNLTILQASSNATALTITPIANTLTYVANAVSRVYGAANPAFTGTVIGLQNNDVLGNVTTGTPTFSSAATAASNVGSYAIYGSGLTVTSANYSTDVLQALGNATALTIIPATLTYTANAASRPFGAANPTFTGSVTGLQNGNALGSVTSGTLTFNSTATSASAVGQYPIDGSGLTVTSPNYNLTILQASSNATALTITPAGGPGFPSSFTLLRVNGNGNLPIQLNDPLGHNGFLYVPVSTVTYDPSTNDIRSLTLSQTPNLADQRLVTFTRSSGAGGAHSQAILGTAVLPGEGNAPVPAYLLSSWSNGTIDYSGPGNVGSGTVLLGPNETFQTIAWGYSGDLFLNPVSFGGKALFNLEHALPAVWTNGQSAPGSFTSGQVAVAIGTTSLRYGMIGTVVMSEGTFNMSTPGGITDPSQSGAIGAISGQIARIQSNNNGSVSYTQAGPTNACPNTCYSIMEFNTIAPGKVAVIYRLGDGPNFDNGNNNVEIGGIATFAQSSTSSLSPSAGFVSFIETFSAPVIVSTGPAKGTLQVTSGVPVLQSVITDGGVTRTQNTATSTDIGSVPGILGWERWTNGSVTTESGSINIPVNSGLHFVDGLLATNLPSTSSGAPSPGTAVQYSLLGATHPTVTDGSVAPGTLLNTSKIGIDFLNLKVGVDLFVGIGGGTYEMKTTGGASNPSSSSIALTGAQFSSAVHTVNVNVLTPSASIGCTGTTCLGTVTGFLAGDGVGNNGGGNPNGAAPPDLGLNYSFNNTGGPFSAAVSGAAAFGRDLPVGNVVGYAFSSTQALPVGTPAMDLGGGPGIVIGDATTPSGLALGFINIDHGNGTGFQDFDRGAFGSSPGAAHVAEQGVVPGILSWERWTNGTVNDQTSTTYTLTSNQGIHVLNGVLATNIPTSGTYTYNLVGATAPTMADGSVSPGTLLGNSTVGVAFGSTPTVGVNLNVQIGGGTYNIQSSGGSAAPSLSATSLISNGLFNASGIPTALTGGTNVVCPSGGCAANVNGFLAGNAASHLGILYSFGNATTNGAKMVSGAAGFAR